LKYGKIIVPEQDRKEIIEALWNIGACILSIDKDKTVCKSLESVYYNYIKTNPQNDKMIFAKGGDRFENEIPEKAICDKLGVKIVDGLGEKIESSSDLLTKI
jgi:D-beta-D-heptose 7-phosphate kinase/D-beta-D-heptose 1-phosphate adenosyltransferase